MVVVVMVVVVVVAVVVGEGLGRSWGKKGGGRCLLEGQEHAVVSHCLLLRGRGLAWWHVLVGSALV